MRSHLISLTLLVLLLGACRAKKTIVQHNEQQHTEIRSGVSQRDTLVPLPGAQVEATLPLPPPGMDLPPTTARSERAWTTVSINQGTLTYAGGCDTVEIALTLWDRWQSERQDKVVTDTRYERVEVPVTPRWAWYALGAALLLGLWKLAPLLLRLIKLI